MACVPRTYTAPADGWVQFKGVQNTYGGWVQLSTTRLLTWLQSPTDNFVLGGYIPICKGENLRVDYDHIDKTYFRFIYAVGSEPTA